MQVCPMCNRWETDADLRICELKHSYVTLMRDQFFPGYTLLSTKIHCSELFQLDREVRSELMEEVSCVAKVLYDIFQPAKINYELLGNMVPHIHWHLVPRFATDPLWPRPIWAEPHVDVLLTPAEYLQRREIIRSALL